MAVMIPAGEDEDIIRQLVDSLNDPDFFSVLPPGVPADGREE
jgi:hypothetical protein